MKISALQDAGESTAGTSRLDSAGISKKIDRTVLRLADFIVAHVEANCGFGMRSFYGESFCLALFRLVEKGSPRSLEILRARYDAMDRLDPQHHWEFNNYAMLELGELGTEPRFKNTSCTNWTLLRSNVRVRAGVEVRLGLAEAREKLVLMQDTSGLIRDDPGVNSFQYHCFSAAMVFEIYKSTGERDFLHAFERAVSFIRHFILPNGDTLYVGRGQQQSFGYASLVYVLSAAYSISPDEYLLGDLAAVVELIESHAREDGSLPLVLGGGDEPLPHADDAYMDHRYPGWYAYNNFFDYLPFAGVFMAKASSLLRAARVLVARVALQLQYRDRRFRKFVYGDTIAVIAKPGGYWTNDLTVPYVYEAKVRTPCYGGEQFGASPYSILGLPLPTFGGRRSLRRWSRSFLIRDSIVIVSPVGILIRSFLVEASRVGIQNFLISPFRWRDRYLIGSPDLRIRSTYPLIERGEERWCRGTLRVFEAQRICDIELTWT